MAETAQIQAQARQQLGTRANRRLRTTGALPGVIYGHKEAIVPITLPAKEMALHLDHGRHVFSLNFDGRIETVLVKEVQYDHFGKDLIHVDFARVNLDERVEVTVPIELKGESVGQKDGGVLQQIISELEIECLVTEIPDSIRHDISELPLDGEVRISDLKLPEGIKVLQDTDQVVCAIHAVKEEEPEITEEVASDEPEIIGRKKEDEEEAEEEKKK